jgi:uncharacterized protein YndB with AHSA1/START domain
MKKKWWIWILGIPAGLLLLASGVLLILGAMPDSNRLQSSIVIQRRPEVVWPWLYKPNKLLRWVSWLKEVREEGEGDIRVGGKAVWIMEDRNNNNALMAITGVAERVEPYRLIAIRLSAEEGFHGESIYTLTDLGNGATRLDSDSRYHMPSVMFRLLMPMVIPQARQKMNSDLERLRAEIEAGPIRP